ncbi:MAG TPA: oligopeptide/dipeptide ABC transporter ATP-binding protein [Polyangiales bacterium]|nr:oligopeptide/dipeptide ABC transporter ATP-binding protein [Polyangiales bacterium]
MTSIDNLIEVADLRVDFPVRTAGGFWRTTQTLHAVDGVSFSIAEGETLGLVGESGCGKSTTGRAVLQLLQPSSGEVTFEGRALTKLWRKRFGAHVWSEELRALRSKMQMIFQDPYASLNPRMTVEDIVSEPLRTFQTLAAPQIAQRVAELLEQVGLDPRLRKRYPHEFSGGQRQRIGIARAIALKPRFIVCDEPISALDVSIQAQILNLLAELRRSYGLTYLFIAHDLAAVRHISDRIAVMYLGKIVEIADSAELCARPLHPYTQGLIAAVPVADPKRERSRTRLPLFGELPSPLQQTSGCRFHPRCPIAIDRCSIEVPTLSPVHDAPLKRFVACHRVTATSAQAVST